MSLAVMKANLDYHGGKYQQDRMIRGKYKSFLSSIKAAYQAARFTEYPEERKEVVGLFNPVTQNENFDTKMISIPYHENFKVGTIFKWCNTGYYWIIFTQDKTELAYFRGECRRCDWKTNWVDKDKVKHEAVLSIIGPSATQMRTSSSMQAKMAEDFPNENLTILTANTPDNKAFFARYQKFVLQGKTYMVENIDNLSMPGVIQIHAYEYYTNLIEDDVEEDLRNKWNVQPIIAEENKHLTEYAIEGESYIKPMFEYKYHTFITGGFWFTIENEVLEKRKKLPVTLIENNRHTQDITLRWDSARMGAFTLAYKVNDFVYQKYILVESLM